MTETPGLDLTLASDEWLTRLHDGAKLRRERRDYRNDAELAALHGFLRRCEAEQNRRHPKCRDPECDLRVDDLVMIADQYRYGVTGVIVAVNCAPTHGCVQVRCDGTGELEWVLCPLIRKQAA